MILVAGLGMVPSRYPNNWTPRSIGTTWAFHNRKFVRVSLHEIAVAILAELIEEEDVDMASNRWRTSSRSEEKEEKNLEP